MVQYRFENTKSKLKKVAQVTLDPKVRCMRLLHPAETSAIISFHLLYIYHYENKKQSLVNNKFVNVCRLQIQQSKSARSKGYARVSFIIVKFITFLFCQH